MYTVYTSVYVVICAYAARMGVQALPRRMKLLDATLKFNEESKMMLAKAAGTDFLVVGTLGPAGAGKSTLLSALHGTVSHIHSFVEVICAC